MTRDCVRRVLAAASASVFLIAGFATTAGADETASVAFASQVAINGHVDVSGCTNNPGPTITFSGTIALGGFDAQLTLKNNVKGTHEADIDAQFTFALIFPTGGLSIPKQPVLGGVGGNPHVWVDIVDDNGNSLTGNHPIYLGRCVQGLSADAGFKVLNAATAALLVSALECNNNPGPYITLGPGSLTHGGLKARLILQNADNPVGGPHRNDQNIVDVVILPSGFSETIPKQPPLGGAGGNPLVYLQFLQGDGVTAIGDEISLGRCNKI
jgi:hypothetical protein